MPLNARLAHMRGVLVTTVFMCAAMALYFVVAHSDRPALSTKTALDDVVPLVPSFVFIYLSIYVVGPLAALGIDRAVMRRAAPRFVFIVVVLFTCFIAVPTVVERPELVVDTVSTRVLQSVYDLDDTARNAAPSGHVALAIFMGWVFFEVARERSSKWRARLKPAVVVYVSLVVVSVVLTGQHHVVDLATGALLAFSALMAGRLRCFRARSRPR